MTPADTERESFKSYGRLCRGCQRYVHWTEDGYCPLCNGHDEPEPARIWLVSYVSPALGTAFLLGPYSRKLAEAIAASLNGEVVTAITDGVGDQDVA